MSVSTVQIVGAARTSEAAARADRGPAGAGRADAGPAGRVRTAGKFFAADGEKFYLRGATYGPFRPGPDGDVYHTPAVVDRDFAVMAAHGVNAVRTYTAPPRWLLDLAHHHGLRVLAGIPWTQHVAFLDEPALVRDSFALVDRAVEVCGGHPALLGLAVGNEIPAPVVRWYGHRRIERHLDRLCRLVHGHDPAALVTYANYPTTEYLDLPFLDFVSFNVYLDSPDRFDAYLSRLQNIAGERPLVLSEIGMDSVHHGDAGQSALLEGKVAAILGRGGAAGMFVFSWTDEWHRHGTEITQWKFGLTTADRRPRPALAAVAAAYARVPSVPAERTPRVSVLVCSYNGAATIAETLAKVQRLDYPDFEVIVVDDGSTNGVSRVAERFPVRLITQENRGLSAARNAALHAATGEVVAYLDDDAYPDPHWLTYLVRTLQGGNPQGAPVVGVGGPNLARPRGRRDGRVRRPRPRRADARPARRRRRRAHPRVQHGLLPPGAARRRRVRPPVPHRRRRRRHLLAAPGPGRRPRLQPHRPGLAPPPAHRPRLLAAAGQLRPGRGRPRAEVAREVQPRRPRHLGRPGLRQGGDAASCSTPAAGSTTASGARPCSSPVYHVPAGLLASLPMTPEWYVLLAGLAGLSLLGRVWPPLLLAVPVLVAAVAVAWVRGRRPTPAGPSSSRPATGRAQRVRMRARIAVLYRLQPLARFLGRYRHGLTPWRLRGVSGFAAPVPGNIPLVKAKWKATNQWLQIAERHLRAGGATVLRGSDFDRWDLEVRGGMSAAVRVRVMTEDLGDERQLVRWRAMPRVLPAGRAGDRHVDRRRVRRRHAAAPPSSPPPSPSWPSP